MIALLFALLLVCMLLAWGGLKNASLVLFAIVIVASVYWFKFHATTELTIML